MSGFRVTYATLSADDDELHAAYDAAVEEVRSTFGGVTRRTSAAGTPVGRRSFRTVSPVDLDVVIGEFAVAPPATSPMPSAPALDAAAGVGGDGLARAVRRCSTGPPTRSAPTASGSPRGWRGRSARAGWRRSATSRSRPT